ncbi:MAG: heat-inducible transcriptional repressor HrcA [Sphingomonadaceae bacterium]|nr:heat-inducible transcriptional repressor HrcA [Thermaurantiacus sp.]MCS6986991.1 heat-inducible transcriptional repressor HrcA [Sphingomonadaceae bacterium]MDW8415671.1 heat-inducible transcriptional repressor HrcA [Thermaurantiacus sp.]
MQIANDPGSAGAIAQLTERARIIFRDIVETYLATGEPVGSRTLAKAGGLGLSAASIRNVMQDLEELGLLTAPHTSAGRMPTERGLRLFVDGMMQVSPPTEAEIAAIEAEARAQGSSLEDALARTTSALSGLARCAAVVVAPKSEAAIRQLSLVPLSSTRILSVLVGTDGTVENRIIELPEPIPASTVAEAETYMNARLSGLTLAEASRRLASEIASGRAELDRLTAGLVQEGLAAWTHDASGPVLIVRGTSHLLGSADLERARLLLEELEAKEQLLKLLDEARAADALKIFIGAETRLFALSGSAVVAAPYRGADGRILGVVGVIGPTRLNYARVVPIVDFAASRISRLMGQE